VICNVTLHNSYIRSNGNFAGGICAYSHGAQVTACHNDSLVNSLYYIAGGIAGVNMYGTVTDCSNTGTVYGAVGAGGVLGEQCAYGSVTGSYNAGSIAAEESSGGICGRSENSTIENCYNIGSVQGGTSAAGIAAYGMGDSRVENCYSAGEIVCTEGVSGGISGDDLSVCANCYYLEETAAGNCATEGIASVSLTHISSSAFAQELGDAFLLSEGENMPVLCWQTQADVPVITEATTTTTATTTTETTTTTATAKSTTTATKATTTSTNATTTKKASTTTKAGTTTAAIPTDTTVTATTGSGMQTITIWAVNNVKVLYGEGSTLQLLIDGNTGVPQWATMDHTVATVDANGLVTAVHTGTVTIVATVDGVAASVTLTVAPAEETTTMTTTSTTTTTTTTTVTTVKAFSRGDCNGDQKVDLEDATEVLRYYALTAAGLEASFRTQAQEDMLAFYAADVNRDDQIDLTDATMILRYYAYNAAGLPAVWSMD
jgi:hypothetical protein